MVLVTSPIDRGELASLLALGWEVSRTLPGKAGSIEVYFVWRDRKRGKRVRLWFAVYFCWCGPRNLAFLLNGPLALAAIAWR